MLFGEETGPPSPEQTTEGTLESHEESGWHHWVDHIFVPGGIGCVIAAVIIGAWAKSKFDHRNKKEKPS